MGRLPEKGDVVLGKYRIVGQLGRGGMGVVFEAVNVGTDGRVALKLLHPSADDSTDRFSRMAREARAAAKLRSRFVARVFDFDHTSDGSPVMVMELLEGHDLSVEMRRTGAMDVGDALSYIVQACAGVGEAHSVGVVHRDLKPGNLFLDRSQAATPTLRVLDFGLSKLLLDNDAGADLTSPSDAIGTLSYMSPEQMRASKNVDARTDVWALGVIAYRALTGKLPHEGRGLDVAARVLDDRPMPRVEREGVSSHLAAVVARALEKKASNRYPSARELGHALTPFITQPSATTKLAFDELSTAPSPDVRAPLPAPVPGEDDSTTHTAVTADTIVAPVRTSHVERKAPRARVTRETRYLLVGTGVLGLASLVVAGSMAPRAAAPAPRAAAPPPAAVVPATTTAPVVVLPPAPAPAPVVPPPAASSASRTAPITRPKVAAPAPAKPARDENDNPIRF